MKYVVLKHLEPGMIIGKDIDDKNYSSTSNIKLVKENTMLTERIIQLLQSKGYTGVYVKDDLTNDIEIRETINDVVRRKTMEAIRNKDIEEISNQSKEMVASIYSGNKMEFDLLRMIESRDIEGHSLNVCELSLALGKAANFSQDKLQILAITALLHDIGKFLTPAEKQNLNIPEVLINHCKQLNMDKEYFLHPIYSYEYLSRFSNISALTKQAVLFHHETENGSGFPFGINGDKVSDISKIISICDCYELNLRKYGNPIDARNKVQENYAYGLYNPEFMSLFLSKIPIYPKGTTVKLSDGNLAIVVDNNENYPERPIVRLESGETINLMDMEKMSLTILKLYCGNYESEIEENLDDKDSNRSIA